MTLFKDLINLWRSDNSLTQALSDSYKMLGTTNKMFKESTKSLRECENGEIGVDIEWYRPQHPRSAIAC